MSLFYQCKLVHHHVIMGVFLLEHSISTKCL